MIAVKDEPRVVILPRTRAQGSDFYSLEEP